VIRVAGIEGLFERAGEHLAPSLKLDGNVSKVSLAFVLSVFTGLVMSGTSQGERLDPGMAIGLFAAVAVSGFLFQKQRAAEPTTACYLTMEL